MTEVFIDFPDHGHYHYAYPHGAACRCDTPGPVIGRLPDGRCDDWPRCPTCHPTDPRPLPSEGPEYHADLAAWRQRQDRSYPAEENDD